MIIFEQYNGDLMGLPTSNNHLVYRWPSDTCKILFSAARQGNAMSCHFASDKNGLRILKKAIGEFCKFCIVTFEWCTMIFAKVRKQSVVRLIAKCGFRPVHRSGGGTLCVRSKAWVL